MTARIFALALATLALSAPAAADGDPLVAWGGSALGLRIGLAATPHPERHRGVTLALQLQNTGETPLRIPGRLRLPWNWRFEFDAQAGGPTLLAHFAQPPEPVDPPEPPPSIELAPGERFPLRFDCRHWVQQELRTIARPRAGAYRIVAASVPVGAEPDLDAWTGEVHSGAVTVEIAFRDSPVSPEVAEPNATEPESPETPAPIAEPEPGPSAAPVAEE